MIKHLNFFSQFYLLLVLGLFSCNNNTGVTPNGFSYKIHGSGEGETVAYGNYAYTWFSISTPDSILFETNEPDGKRVLLRDPNKQSGKVKDPVLDILPLLRIGDTATVTVVVDDLMRLTDDLKEVKELYYSVTVKKIETKEERRKAQSAEHNRRKNETVEKLQKKSLQMQADPVGSMAYQLLRTSIASYTVDPRLQKSQSGLEYIIFEEGEKPFCKTEEQISVHYIGMQEEGLVFDETYSYDQVFTFALNRGRVIKAWDEGLQHLGLNGEAFFKVPPELGYGATGYLPLVKPNTTMYFYVKVMAKK